MPNPFPYARVDFYLSCVSTIHSLPPSHDTERFYVINFSIAKVNTNFPLLSLTYHQNLEYGYCYNAFFKPFNAFYFRSDCNKNADEQVL